MKIPLIVAGSHVGDYSPVRLRSGRWTFEQSDDSSVTLICSNLPECEAAGSELVLDSPCVVYARVNTRVVSPKPLWLFACLTP